MTALPPRPEMGKRKQRGCHHGAPEMFAKARGNLVENAKDNSQYAYARASIGKNQAIQIKIDRTKTQWTPRISAQSKQICLPDLEN
jgi:hypothetical protein